MKSTTMLGMAAALAVSLSVSTLSVRADTAAALTGKVTSEAEGAMEGVVVTAHKDGSIVATSVTTDAKGRYAFPEGKIEGGDYTLRIYRVGYKFNDAYTRYLEMGAPCQITRAQVSELKKLSTGEPELTQKIQIDGQGVLERQLPLRENDVYLVTLDRQ